MSSEDLEIVAEFCTLVDSNTLLSYLGLPDDAAPDAALAALKKSRRRLQGMQSNPKFRDSARFLIKNIRVFERVLADPGPHLSHQNASKEEEKVPMLEFAIDAVLSDGVFSHAEEGFIRQAALSLGISEATYDRVLKERADAKCISLTPQPISAKPSISEGEMEALSGEPTAPSRNLRGAEGHSWWDVGFTRHLLDCIPPGPGDLVDIYCRTALSALTILPERRQIDWLGIERSTDRLEAARETLQGRPRVRFAQGAPSALPIEDDSVDFVLGIRALANLADTEPVLAEAKRVLRPGGRLILAEPDGLGETFYFDANLSAYNTVFQRLCRKIDEQMVGTAKRAIGKPGICLGPSLSERMRAAGFEVARVQVHSSATLQRRTFGKFVKLLRRYPTALSQRAGLGPENLERLNLVVDAMEKTIPTDHVGLCGNVLPIFLVVGINE